MATSEEELRKALLARRFSKETKSSGRVNPFIQTLESAKFGIKPPEPVLQEPVEPQPREDISGFSLNELIERRAKRNPNYIDALDNEYIGQDVVIEEEKTPDSDNPFVTAIRGISRGGAQTALTAGQGILALADAVTDAVGFEELIDSEDGEMIRLLNEAREYVGYEEGAGGKLAEAIGSMLIFAVPGMAQAGFSARAATAAMKGQQGLQIAQQANRYAKGMQALKFTTAGGVGAGTSDQMMKAYKEAGGEYTTGQKNLALAMGVGIGFTELLPIEMILKGLPRALDRNVKNSIVKRIANAVADGGMEGVQEVGASLAQEYSAQMIYNPDQEIGESMLSDFGYGGGAGAIFSLFLRGKGRKIGRTQADQQALADDYEQTQPSPAFTDKELPVDKKIAIYDTNGKEIEGKVISVNPDDNTSTIEIEDGDIKRKINVPLRAEINNEGYSLFSDEELFNPKNSLDIADKDGNVINYPVGNPEKTTNEILEKEETRLSKLAAQVKISEQDVFKLKVIRTELARREALTSDTLIDPEQIDVEKSQQDSLEEEAQTGSSKFIRDVDDLTRRTTQEAEAEAEARARQEGIDVETDQFVPVPNKFSNTTFDLPDPDSSIAYNLGRRGKDPSEESIERTAIDLDLSVNELRTLSKSYASDVQAEIKKQKKGAPRYTATSFKQYAEQNKPYDIRDKQIARQRKELKIANPRFRQLINQVTDLTGVNVEDLNSLQRAELVDLMSKEKQAQDAIKNQEQVKLETSLNDDGNLEIKVKSRADTKKAEPLETIVIESSEDGINRLLEMGQKYNLSENDTDNVLQSATALDQNIKASQLTNDYFRALDLATKNKTVTVKGLQKKLYGTDIDNLEDFRKTQEILLAMQEQGYVSEPTANKPTSKRQVLQKFTAIDTAGEILVQDVDQEGNRILDITQEQEEVANKVKNIIEGVAPGSQLKLAHVIRDRVTGNKLLGAQFKNIIAVTLDGREKDITSPAYHEATHYLWNNGFFNEQQRKTILDNRDYLRQIVKNNIITNETQYNSIFSPLDEAGEMDELLAYTSGYYNASMDLNNTPPTFLTDEVNGILNNLYEMFKQLARYVSGNNTLFTPTEQQAITQILDDVRSGAIGRQDMFFNTDGTDPVARRAAIITGYPDGRMPSSFQLQAPLKDYIKQTQLKQKKKGSEWLFRNDKGQIDGVLKKAKFKTKFRTSAITDTELKNVGLYQELTNNPDKIYSGQELLNIIQRNENMLVITSFGENTNEASYGVISQKRDELRQRKRTLFDTMIQRNPVDILWSLSEANKQGFFAQDSGLITNFLSKYVDSEGNLKLGRKVEGYNQEEVSREILDLTTKLTDTPVDSLVDIYLNANPNINKAISDFPSFRLNYKQYMSELGDTPEALFRNRQKNTRIMAIKLLHNPEGINPMMNTGISLAQIKESVDKVRTDAITTANTLVKEYGYTDEFLTSFVDLIENLSTQKRLELEHKRNTGGYNTESSVEDSNNLQRRLGSQSQEFQNWTFPSTRGQDVNNYGLYVFSMPNLNLEDLEIVRQEIDPDLEVQPSLNKFGKGKNIISFPAYIKTKRDTGFGTEILEVFQNDRISSINHFNNIANPFAHFRSTDFITVDGEKVLVVEEIQADYLNYLEDALNIYITYQMREKTNVNYLSFLKDMRTLVPNNLLDRYDAYVELERTLEERTLQTLEKIPSIGILDEEAALRLDNLASERKEFSRLLARQDIRSPEQTQYKEMIEINQLPDIPYKTQNEMIEFVSNFAIQKAASEAYDGIAIVNSELQNERYRHNFKNSISSIEAEFIELRSEQSGLVEEFVIFRYGIPQSLAGAMDTEQLDLNQSEQYMMPLSQVGLDKDEFLSADDVFEFEDRGVIYNGRTTFQKFIGQDISDFLQEISLQQDGVVTIEDLPEVLREEFDGNYTGIDLEGRVDIPVGSDAFKQYDRQIPQALEKEMLQSLPANKRKEYRQDRKYLYSRESGAKIINENEILDQPQVEPTVREALGSQIESGRIAEIDRLTSNVTNALRFFPITEEMRKESEDSMALGSTQARRMAVVNSGKKERDNLSRNIRDSISNFVGNSKMFDPLYGVPMQRDYLLNRGRALGIFNQAERIALKLRKDIAPYLDKNNPLRKSNHQEVRALLFKYLSTSPKNGELALYKQLKDVNPRMAKTALDAKDIIERLGQQLVEANIIPASSFEINKRSYLPRLYIEHVLKNPAGDARSYAKKRKEDASDSLTVIDELAPEFLVSRAIQRPMRDLAMLEFYNSIAKNRQWTLDGDLADVEYDGKKVSFFWLYEQQKQYREIAQYLDRDPERKAKMLKEADDMLVVANQARDRYAQEYDIRPEDIFNQEQSESRFQAPEGFKRVPNNRLYGLMAGKAVRSGIYEDIISSISYTAWGDNNYVKAGKLARQLTSTWKLIKVPLNPPTVARNVMSNAILMNLSGMPIRRIMPNFYKAVNEMIAFGKGDMANSKHYKALLDRGVAETSFTEAELFRWAEDFKEFTTERSINELGILSWLHLKGWRRLANKASFLYQNIEVMGKTAMAIEMMENQNKNADEAYLIAQDALFDYSLVSPTVRGLRTSPIGIPFLTFMYKVTPKLIDVALNNPFRLAPYMAMGMVLPQLFMHMFDIDDDDYEKIKQLLPSYTNDFGTFPIPYRDDAGRMQFLDLGYIMPHGFITQLLEQAYKAKKTLSDEPQAEDFDLGEILRTLGLFGGPAWSLAGLFTNTDPFLKRNIAREGEPLFIETDKDFDVSIPGIFKKDGKVVSYVQYAMNQFFLPSFLHTEYGATNRLISAVQESGEVNDKNRLTINQALLKFIGLNIFAIDPKQNEMAIKMLEREVNDLKSARRRMARDNSLSVQDRNTRKSSYDEAILDRREKISFMKSRLELFDAEDSDLVGKVKSDKQRSK